MKKNIIKYGLYAFSFVIGVIIIISAYYGYFKEQELGLISFIATGLSGLLFLPFVFIIIAKQSKITREQVLKIAVGLWLIGIFLPVIGL